MRNDRRGEEIIADRTFWFSGLCLRSAAKSFFEALFTRVSVGAAAAGAGPTPDGWLNYTMMSRIEGNASGETHLLEVLRVLTITLGAVDAVRNGAVNARASQAGVTRCERDEGQLGTSETARRTLRQELRRPRPLQQPESVLERAERRPWPSSEPHRRPGTVSNGVGCARIKVMHLRRFDRRSALRRHRWEGAKWKTTNERQIFRSRTKTRKKPGKILPPRGSEHSRHAMRLA